MDRRYLYDNHRGRQVFAKCWCGCRWETKVTTLQAEYCPSCNGMLRISYSVKPFMDSEQGNYNRAIPDDAPAFQVTEQAMQESLDRYSEQA